jgi:Holliday junction resolvase RusA-like endonuclease
MMLALLLLAAPDADPRRHPVVVEPDQAPVARAHSECLVKQIAGVPLPDEGRSDYLGRAVAVCRAETLGRLNGGGFSGISRDPASRPRLALDKVLDGVEAQFTASFMNIPTVARTNAKVAEAGLGVTVYDPAAAQQERYSRCVTDARKRERPATDAEGRVRSWRKAIASCRDVKARMMAEADAALARQSDFRDPARRSAAVAEMFDGYDRIMLRMAASDWSKP